MMLVDDFFFVKRKFSHPQWKFMKNKKNIRWNNNNEKKIKIIKKTKRLFGTGKYYWNCRKMICCSNTYENVFFLWHNEFLWEHFSFTSISKIKFSRLLKVDEKKYWKCGKICVKVLRSIGIMDVYISKIFNFFK